MKRPLLLALGGLWLAGGLSAEGLPVGDAARGETLIGQCRTCHGADGMAKLVSAPHIAGDPEPYLATQLAAFRDGLRENEMMSLVVRPLDDQAIADLAAFYASQPFSAEEPTDISGAPLLCTACHGETGMAAQPDIPHIAGDSAEYIAAQLDAFRGGHRVNEVMNGIAADLTDDDIAAAAEWYSAIAVSAD